MHVVTSLIYQFLNNNFLISWTEKIFSCEYWHFFSYHPYCSPLWSSETKLYDGKLFITRKWKDLFCFVDQIQNYMKKKLNVYQAWHFLGILYVIGKYQF